MELAEIDYRLPEELIAQHPLPARDASRLLVVNRAGRSVSHRQFADLLDYLEPGDLLVVNDTKVLRARLRMTVDTGSRVELLLIDGLGGGRWRCLAKPAKRLTSGREVRCEGAPIRAIALEREGEFWRMQFEPANGLFEAWLDARGEVPLPPYIHRAPTPMDVERYQTVFAEHAGAVAAPTAGLHFTKPLLAHIRTKGVRVASVTLHVSYGTFAPIREEDPRQHRMHQEWCEVPEETAALINQTKAHGKRVIAVGTTTCRTLETMGLQQTPPYRAQRGWTDLFILPPHQFRIVDVLLTNFHAPRSSLVLLVSAFLGEAWWREIYEAAIRQRYRFLSYGDAMLAL